MYCINQGMLSFSRSNAKVSRKNIGNATERSFSILPRFVFYSSLCLQQDIIADTILCGL